MKMACASQSADVGTTRTENPPFGLPGAWFSLDKEKFPVFPIGMFPPDLNNWVIFGAEDFDGVLW